MSPAASAVTSQPAHGRTIASNRDGRFTVASTPGCCQRSAPVPARLEAPAVAGEHRLDPHVVSARRQSRRSIHLHAIDVGGGLHVAGEIELQRPRCAESMNPETIMPVRAAGGRSSSVGPALGWAAAG